MTSLSFEPGPPVVETDAFTHWETELRVDDLDYILRRECSNHIGFTKQSSSIFVFGIIFLFLLPWDRVVSLFGC